MIALLAGSPTVELDGAGCAVVGSVLLIGVVVVLMLLRRRSLRAAGRRRAELAPVLERRGLEPRPGSRLPGDAPHPTVTPLVPAVLPPVLFAGEHGGSRFYLFDVEIASSRPFGNGFNVHGVQRDDEWIHVARHTVLAWGSEAAALPAMQLVPADRRSQGGRFDPTATLRRLDLDPDDPAVRAAADRVAERVAPPPAGAEGWRDLRERTGALPFPGAPEFEAAYRVHGTDADAVRRLFPPEILALLLGRPGVIAECRDGWLFLSLAVEPAFGEAPAEAPGGLLAPDRVDELLRVGLELAPRWLGSR